MLFIYRTPKEKGKKRCLIVIIIYILVYNIRNFIYTLVWKVHVITDLSVFNISNQYIVKWSAAEKLKM